MDPRRSAALVLAKMALADGVIDPAEQDFLEDLIEESAFFTSVEELLKEAEEKPLRELIAGLQKYEDRFLIALRVYLMARVDQHLDEREEALFYSLIDLLAITKADRVLIETTESNARSGQLAEPDPRVQEMFEASSFCEE